MTKFLLILAMIMLLISTNPSNRFATSHVRNIYIATIYTTQFGDTLVGALNNIVSIAEVKDFLTEYPQF